MQEEPNDPEHQRHRLEEGDGDLTHRDPHVLAGVVRDRPPQPRRKLLAELLHPRLDRVGDLQRIGTGRERNGRTDHRAALAGQAERVVLSSELHAGDVPEAYDLSALPRFENDALELLRIGEPALAGDAESQVHALSHRLAANSAGRGLGVLLTNRRSDIVGRQTELSEPVGAQPDADRVVARAEHLHAANAGDAAQLVNDVGRAVVRDIQTVVTAVWRVQRHDLQNGRQCLLHRDALSPDLLREQL